MDRQPLEEVRLLRAEVDRSPLLLNRQLLSFTGAPYLTRTSACSPIAPLTLSSSPRAWWTPLSTNHRRYGSSGGFIPQQHREAAGHYAGGTNRRSGTRRGPAGCSSPWVSQCWLPAHFAYHLGSWERWDTFISLPEECASSWKKKQHNVKCKDYFSNKLNLCCTWLLLRLPPPEKARSGQLHKVQAAPGKTMGSFSCQNEPSRSPF